MNAEPTNRLRPETPVQYVKGIGPKRSDLLRRAGIETIQDLLYYFPRKYLDRSSIVAIRDLKPGREVTVVGRVYSAEQVAGRRKRFVVLVGDGTGFLQCVWFMSAPYMSRLFKPGETVAFSGKASFYRGLQIVHPEYDKISEEGELNPLHTGGIIPMYASTESLSEKGLDSRGFRKILHALLPMIPGIMPETLPESLLAEEGLMPLGRALTSVHFPADAAGLAGARHRLKFEELFFIQLHLALERKRRETVEPGIAFEAPGRTYRSLAESLPFEMTGAQKRVLGEILGDMKSQRPMNRLLQGDVGSGKTVVAVLAMLNAVDNGYQAVLMAPTEILAEQHYITLHRWLEEMGLHVCLLRGGQAGRERRDLLERIAGGTAHLVVGTHVLLESGVRFHRLGLVVIDEQHRFGVLQRAALQGKGARPDVLVMTATPIPRTLALTLYGDLDVSVLDERPPGRKPVRTVWRGEDKREKIYDYLREQVGKGRQVYIVYPLVEESEKIDLAAATVAHKRLSREVFPEFRVDLLHGRMKPEDKERIMQEFKEGRTHILVSTTVIEVGVDVPNAAVMLVEHAERFGLTQLHQLRGRVGRGQAASTCILLAAGGLSDDARTRLSAMEATDDGFRIAETDLEIRGPGELFGTRQHGMLNLRIANLITDGKILESARKTAFRLVEKDPDMRSADSRGLIETYQKHHQARFGLLAVG